MEAYIDFHEEENIEDGVLDHGKITVYSCIHSSLCLSFYLTVESSFCLSFYLGV